MVFNGLLIIFDIRNIIQWAYLFIRIPVKKLQPIVSSILGHIYSIVSCLHFYGLLCDKWNKIVNICSRKKLKMHWNGLQKIFLLSYYTSKSEQAENSLVIPYHDNYPKHYYNLFFNFP